MIICGVYLRMYYHYTRTQYNVRSPCLIYHSPDGPLSDPESYTTVVVLHQNINTVLDRKPNAWTFLSATVFDGQSFEPMDYLDREGKRRKNFLHNVDITLTFTVVRIRDKLKCAVEEESCVLDAACHEIGSYFDSQGRVVEIIGKMQINIDKINHMYPNRLTILNSYYGVDTWIDLAKVDYPRPGKKKRKPWSRAVERFLGSRTRNYKMAQKIDFEFVLSTAAEELYDPSSTPVSFAQLGSELYDPLSTPSHIRNSSSASSISAVPFDSLRSSIAQYCRGSDPMIRARMPAGLAARKGPRSPDTPPPARSAPPVPPRPSAEDVKAIKAKIRRLQGRTPKKRGPPGRAPPPVPPFRGLEYKPKRRPPKRHPPPPPTPPQPVSCCRWSAA